ncbi:ATP-dependent DNA helicase [Terribacillus saccharophilus]|uniref:Helicase ATP-binding domain-containing protein n=1 Tax=Terribacillus saccharophilus TaxID=361277 RepID=A0A268AB11_9BACI|nr:hypothetical protein CHH64_09455 [Terribacillus saccharophilus]
MAFDIASFVQDSNTKRIMIAEAPVGTGKSLGSLIPTLVEADIKEKKIVYATATINLQSQLMNSEVPLLKHLQLVKKPILAKGKTHYYCHKRLLSNKDKFTAKEIDILNKFYSKSITGHKNDLEDQNSFFPEEKWKYVQLEASHSECRYCELSSICPSFEHRKKFRSSENDLVITNHDQYIVSVLNSMEHNGKQPIVPVNPGILIIDEAHHFIENFLGQIEESFTIKQLSALRRHVIKQKEFEKTVNKIESIIKKERINIGESLQGRYQIPVELIQEITRVKSIIVESVDKYQSQAQFNKYHKLHAIEMLDEWSFVLARFFDDKYVKWIEYDNLKLSAISNTFPSDFRAMMDYIKTRNKIIVMSGTLTSDGNFSAMIAQWRLNRDEVLTTSYKTPFNYNKQALIYVPKPIKHPNTDSFIPSILKHIKNVLHITRGSTLILCTSKEQMNILWGELQSTFDEIGINRFLQGKSGVEKLTKQFLDDEKSVLLGSGSFFSGFSIPGNSLISVILSKLPFPVKDDPFLELIGQGYEEDFFDYIIYPQMINKLNQAAGRLIRSIDDYGIFTVTDPRIFTEEYGLKIQEVFRNQGYVITQSVEKVKQFINYKTLSRNQPEYSKYSRELILVDDSLAKDISKPQKGKSLQSVTRISEPKKKKGVPKAQREFTKMICNREGIPIIKASETRKMYEELIKSLYYNWHDTTVVEENFPFRNQKEKDDLKNIKGSERKKVMPFCSKWNCKGDCTAKEAIAEYLEDKYDTKEIRFLKKDTYCRVFIEPTRILENEEFRP